MVFSLFSRKDKVEPKKDARPAARAENRPSAVSSLAAQREAARRTEQKIDQIESEMIAAEAVARAGLSSLPTKPIGPPAADDPRAAASAEGATSLVLGDAADAMAIDVNGPALPSILEEAAILYSNGQAQQAAIVLRQSLDDPELAGYQALAWLMLLDLHQCVGDRAGFEALALQYAARFESSPPGWSDALSPERANPGAVATADRAGSAAGAGSSRTLTLRGAVDASIAEPARRFAETAEADAQLDCTQAASVDAAGAQALLALLVHFERAKTGLAVQGAERLFAIARTAIEPGRRDPSEACWMLCLQALRILGRQQEFDDLGIEYCVTYEVSPPSWEPIDESIRAVGEDESDAAPSSADPLASLPLASRGSARSGTTGRGAAPTARAASSRLGEPVGPAASTGAFVLRGEVLGRMQDELEALRSFASGRGDVVVDCRSLRRMEFVAAGDLLNEVATMRSAGRQVLFVEPNYLVYALMLVMGIHDLAEIRRRKV
ncbi:MAG TPA: hypothetical protein VK047_04460 [Zeimonas sp.]|nr:hypothetical protein [Zeimonas sp.]